MFNPCLRYKNGRKDEQCCQTVSSYRWQLFLSINLFGSVVETTQIMYRVFGFGYDQKNPSPLWIIWINNPFMDFKKKTKIGFWIKNPDLDFSKETHPNSAVQLFFLCVVGRFD